MILNLHNIGILFILLILKNIYHKRKVEFQLLINKQRLLIEAFYR